MTNSRANTIRVLHVDDNPDFTEMAAEFLERADSQLEVVTESAVSDGLVRLADEPIECIVSDYEMPETDGLEFLEIVQEEYSNLPFILFTGEGSETIASKALTAGVTDYLQKTSGTDQYTLLANRICNAVEQRRTQALRQRLHTAIETAQEGISILNNGGQFTYVNEAYADLYGYSPDDLTGDHWNRLYPEEDIAFVHEEVFPTVEQSGYWHGRTTGLRADGSTFPEDHVVSATDQGGYVCTVRDITDREKREQKLTRLHSATRELIDAGTADQIAAIASEAADDILDIPMNGIHLYDEDIDGLVPVAVSQLTQELLDDLPVLETGIAWEAFQRDEFMVHENVRESENVYNPKTPVHSEMYLPLDNHGILILSSTTVDAFDEVDITLAKLLAANVTSALDLTNHARKLELLQQRSQALMNTSTVATTAEVAVDAAHEILDADLSGFHRVGTEGERLKPIAVAETVHDVFETSPSYDRTAESDPVSAFIWKVFNSGNTVFISATAEHPELAGKTPAESAIIYPITGYGVFIVSSTEEEAFSETDTKLIEILGSTLETALERVERESVLQERTDAIEHQNERLEQFVRIIGHDLRNPLNVASGRLELAENECDSDHFAPVNDALTRITTILEDTLTLAKQGQTIGEFEEIPIGSLANQCWKQVDTADATMKIVDGGMIHGDPDRVRHIFENLFRNAVEHSDGSVTVRVGTSDDGFYIEDTGPGIPDDEHEQIFEPGYSTSDTSTGFLPGEGRGQLNSPATARPVLGRAVKPVKPRGLSPRYFTFLTVESV